MNYSREQVMLTLSLVSYLGSSESAFTPKASAQSTKRLREHIESGLRAVAPLQGEWELAWGPATVRFPLTIFHENLMFVARHKQDSSRYAVVIRGADPISMVTWVLEDLAVLRQVPWPYGKEPSGFSPKIARGAAMGLEAVQTLMPLEGCPGHGTTLYRFLADEVKKNHNAELSIAITGHSLAGALAPLVALWLDETRKRSDEPDIAPWDPGGKATLEVFTFGGPTPGNKDFAAYYDRRLGEHTQRTWNPFDVVPHGWDPAMLAKVAGLYAPNVKTDWLLDTAIWLAQRTAIGRDYLQIAKNSPPMQGASVSGLFKRFVNEMVFQHSVAYIELTDLPVRANDYFKLDENVAWAVHANDPAAEVGKRDTEGVRAIQPLKPSAEQLAFRVLNRIVNVPLSLLTQVAPTQPLDKRRQQFESRLDQPSPPAVPGKAESDAGLAAARPNGPANSGVA